jgi:hypothetical protein
MTKACSMEILCRPCRLVPFEPPTHTAGGYDRFGWFERENAINRGQLLDFRPFRAVADLQERVAIHARGGVDRLLEAWKRRKLPTYPITKRSSAGVVAGSGQSQDAPRRDPGRRRSV